MNRNRGGRWRRIPRRGRILRMRNVPANGQLSCLDAVPGSPRNGWGAGAGQAGVAPHVVAIGTSCWGNQVWRPIQKRALVLDAATSGQLSISGALLNGWGAGQAAAPNVIAVDYFRPVVGDVELLQIMFPDDDKYFLAGFVKQLPKDFPAQVNSIIRRKELNARNCRRLSAAERVRDMRRDRELKNKLDSLTYEIPDVVVDLVLETEDRIAAAAAKRKNDFLKYGYCKK